MRIERHKRERVGVAGGLSRFEAFAAYVRALLGAEAEKGAKRRTGGRDATTKKVCVPGRRGGARKRSAVGGPF